MWFFNEKTGNFAVGNKPTNEIDGVRVEESGWVEIPTRPEPYDNYIFDGKQWIEKTLNIEALKHSFISAIQNLLDGKAQENGYDTILSACSYAGYDNPFRAEGEAYGIWRANCWAYCYEQLALILDNKRVLPTVEEFVLELPIFVIGE